MNKSKNFSLLNIEKLKDFDRYEGSRRHEIKVFDRTIMYRGYEIKRNAYVPQGAFGKWEVPSLKYVDKGGIKTGFLTVSIIQSKEAIDKYFNWNVKLNTL
jgi:hypothetical protein